MKKLIIIGIILVAILTLVASGFGALYFYSLSTRPQLVLQKNAKVLSDVKDLKSFTVESHDNGKVKVVTGISFIDDNPAPAEGEKTSKSYVLNNDTFTVVTSPANTTQQQSLADAQIEEFILFTFKDNQKWSDLLNKRNYVLKNEKVDGKEVWIFEIENKEITDLIVNELKNQLVGSLASEQSSLDVSQTKVNFNGQIKLVVTVDKSTNLITNVVMGLTDDMTIDFGTSFSKILGITETEESNKNLTVTLLKDYQQTNNLKDVVFKDSNFKVAPDKILGIF